MAKLTDLTLLTLNYGTAMTIGQLRALDGNNPLVKYNVNRPYSSVLTFEGKRLVEQQLYKTLNTILPNLVKQHQTNKRKERDQSIKETNKIIIQNGQVSTGDTTQFTTSDGKLLSATDIYGRKGAAVGAIFLAYTTEDKTIKYYTLGETDDKKKKTVQEGVDSKDMVVWDPAPSVSLSSKKNVSVTPVVGRDYSRKELISNSDVTFNVSGKFVSRNPDVYPSAEVQRFIDIMRHQDIIRVQNLFFAQHNVKSIVITDYNLPTPSCLNEQPYSFSCIGVEPAEEGIADTLSSALYEAKDSELEGWYLKILKQYTLQQSGALATQTIISTRSAIESIL